MRTVPFAAAVLALVFAVAPALAQRQPPPSGKSDTKEMTLQQALTVAKENFSDGMLVLARTENKGGVSMFGMYFWYNGRLVEIEIRRKFPTKIEKMEELTDEGPFDKDFLKKVTALKVKAKIPQSRYLEIAKEETGSEAEGYLLSTSSQGLVIQVTTGSGSVSIDANTGKVLK